jgi:hypothetical protein
MTRAQAEAFAKRFTESFAPPFCPEGLVSCSTSNYGEKTSVTFRIGDRDVAFDAEKMAWYGQGTSIGEAAA